MQRKELRKSFTLVVMPFNTVMYWVVRSHASTLNMLNPWMPCHTKTETHFQTHDSNPYSNMFAHWTTTNISLWKLKGVALGMEENRMC